MITFTWLMLRLMQRLLQRLLLMLKLNPPDPLTDKAITIIMTTATATALGISIEIAALLHCKKLGRLRLEK